MNSMVTEATLEALLARGSQCGLLANVLTRTQRMLLSAHASQWDVVAAGEAKRKKLLHECFATPVAEQNSELFAEALAVMLHMNEELMQLLQNAREAAAVQNSDQMRTQKSIKHYLDIDSER